MTPAIRAANAEDIRVGVEVYFVCPNGIEKTVIKEVMNPDAWFNGYITECGCRYGLDGAFVEVAPNV